MQISNLSDHSILVELTQRIRQRRLNLNLTQEQIADKSGLHKQTIKNFESGKNASLLTLIQILRVFGDLDALDQFLPDPGVSPIQLLKLKGKERERASGTKLENESESEW
ncbi:MAG: helix-turn-helix transcriptional regulator [Bacteroidota bacterium]